MTTAIPAIGSVAPDFTADTTAGTKVTLSDFRGKQHVLLAFFPLAFTSTCTAELCAFHDDYSQFEEKGVKVIPMSIDAVPSLAEFKKKLGISVELASDMRRATTIAYGVLNEEKYYSRRSYFLIDKDGVLRWSHVETVPGMKRENEELLAEIAKLG